LSELFAALIGVANRTERPVSEVLRHHFLEAALRRLGARAEPEFVLRGSMITRLWAAPFPRVANDLDFLGTFPHSVADTASRFLPPLSAELADGVRFDVPRCLAQSIWEGSEFPGVRLTLFATVLGEDHVTTVDVGFNDPLLPPADVIDYALLSGEVARVWAVHPATLIGWKLHGLAEWGHARWRPKDLLDLWLLLASRERERPQLLPPVAHAPGSPEQLASAIRVAFESRGFAVSDAKCTIDDPFWETSAASARWDSFCEEQRDVPVPASLSEVRAEVAACLAPALVLLPT
jgi:hypothetical protein